MAKTPAEFDHMTHDAPPTSDMGGALTPAALASAKKKKHRSRPLFDDRASSLAATAQVQADPQVIQAYLGAGDVGDLRRRLREAA